TLSTESDVFDFQVDDAQDWRGTGELATVAGAGMALPGWTHVRLHSWRLLKARKGVLSEIALFSFRLLLRLGF
ncbi:MAG: hypothetical protein ABI925_05075, partial [Verrucomicrobiota bacterium]